jgi:hypothetical protein
VANERLLLLTFELVPNLGQAIPNGTVAIYRFVDANSGVIESLKPRSAVTKNPLDKRHTFMPDLLYGSFRYIRKQRAESFRYCRVDENGVSSATPRAWP